jgi:Uma2 family endonuclease
MAEPEEAGAELIEGVIVYKAMPDVRHGRIQRIIGAILDPYDRPLGEQDQPGGWWLANEVDIKLGTDGVRPDIAGWRRERVPVMPERDPEIKAIIVRPDWVCEVLSPSTAGRDLGEKLRIYHRASVSCYWVVDPANETLTVYRRTDEGYLHVQAVGPTGEVRAEPFQMVAFDVSRLFQ